jgi:hypothetical protein
VSQLALDALWPCDCCNGTGIEVDPETWRERGCRVCQMTGFLDYDPALCAEDPFEGMETQ